jgi:aspartyl/glutamyl-tRNA(Asn/Gln) amidotransferase, C subunit
MSLDPAEVRKIAHLARIAIDEDDIPEYGKNLSSILAFVAEMDAVDTAQVVPMAHPLDKPQRMREDSVIEKDERALYQSCAPLVEAGLYLVPKVIIDA